ncbi:MAG TPA: benzoate-CoA ligase family protein [Streptosporangiaceae bacterium]|nr:benzoate-CoA ligase family protein [Streptosporangiaceae bacterium]
MTEAFNACEYLLDRRVKAGDGARLAVTGVGGELTYAQLLDQVQRAAAVLRQLGLEPEQRLLMFTADGPAFVVLYLAAMRIGAIPVPVSTMMRAAGLTELLADSRARLLAITPEFAPIAAEAVAGAPELRGVVACGGASAGTTGTLVVHDLDGLIAAATPEESIYPTLDDSPAFWLYTSGTTGKSKGAIHRHGSVRVVCETYASQVLGIKPDDRCLSAAKAFFAYGLGNSVLFPLSVGAAAILEPSPSRPDVIAERAREFGATLFFGGPTFFANMLRTGLPGDALGDGVRLAASAGEALPAALYERWTAHFGTDIIDGIGMTEMLHIFLSNAEGQVRPGSTGVAVPGYELKICSDEGELVPDGTPGTLYVRGDSAATGYWSRYDASRQVFQGEWLRTGDTYVRDSDGFYSCLGRTSDMLKVSGMWVSPAEIEDRLLAHQAVAQAVVVAGLDSDDLEKPVAYVVLQPGASAVEAELVEFCQVALPTFKRPRRVVFTDAYPTTATGKIRRVELRQQATAALAEGTQAKEAQPG